MWYSIYYDEFLWLLLIVSIRALPLTVWKNAKFILSSHQSLTLCAFCMLAELVTILLYFRSQFSFVALYKRIFEVIKLIFNFFFYSTFSLRTAAMWSPRMLAHKHSTYGWVHRVYVAVCHMCGNGKAIAWNLCACVAFACLICGRRTPTLVVPDPMQLWTACRFPHFQITIHKCCCAEHFASELLYR